MLWLPPMCSAVHQLLSANVCHVQHAAKIKLWRLTSKGKRFTRTANPMLKFPSSPRATPCQHAQPSAPFTSVETAHNLRLMASIASHSSRQVIPQLSWSRAQQPRCTALMAARNNCFMATTMHKYFGDIACYIWLGNMGCKTCSVRSQSVLGLLQFLRHTWGCNTYTACSQISARLTPSLPHSGVVSLLTCCSSG
jgi:hypothetical protein